MAKREPENKKLLSCKSRFLNKNFLENGAQIKDDI